MDRFVNLEVSFNILAAVSWVILNLCLPPTRVSGTAGGLHMVNASVGRWGTPQGAVSSSVAQGMILDHSHILEGFYISTWGSDGGIIVVCFGSTDHKGYVLFRVCKKRWWSLYAQWLVSLRMTACSRATLYMLAYVAILIHPRYCLGIPGSLTSRQCEVLAATNQRTAPVSPKSYH